jgi:predicted esterase
MAVTRTVGGVTFREWFVEAGGLRFRCLEANRSPSVPLSAHPSAETRAGSVGEGGEVPVLRLHAPGELQLSETDTMIAQARRLIPIELPQAETAPILMALIELTKAMGLERYSVIAGSGGVGLALSLARQERDRIEALVLLSPVVTPDVESCLAEVNVPTLVVFGTRDEVTAPETGRLFRAKMLNCSFALVYDAGHALEADRPEAVASLIAGFLERREIFVVSRESSLINP